MRVPINLASQPLENLRPWRAAVVVTALAALVLAGVIVRREARDRSEFRSLIQQRNSLEQSMKSLESEQRELETWLSTPAAKQIQERSAFLNSLILRKSLSWTQLFMDLEKTLPSQARIVAIRPSLNPSEEVDLNLTAAATSMSPLVEFLKNLESSEQFGAPAVVGQHFPNDKSVEKAISIELTAQYRQERLQRPEQAANEAMPTSQKDPR